MTDGRPRLVVLAHEEDGSLTLTYPVRDGTPAEAITALLRVFTADQLRQALNQLDHQGGNAA